MSRPIAVVTVGPAVNAGALKAFQVVIVPEAGTPIV